MLAGRGLKPLQNAYTQMCSWNTESEYATLFKHLVDGKTKFK
jgi:hypothetical protein